MSSPELQQWLQAGIAAVKAGNQTEAHQLLTQVLAIDERNEQAWLWLSGAVTSHRDRRTCLENVLALNPDNQLARRGLKKLGINPDALTAAAEPAPEPGTFDVTAPDPFLPPAGHHEKRPISPAGAILYPNEAAPAPPEPPAAPAPLPTQIGYTAVSEYDDVWTQDVDLCAYCAAAVSATDTHCPQCKRAIVVKQYRYPHPSSSLHIFWVMMFALSQVSLLQLIYYVVFVRNVPAAILHGGLILVYGMLGVGIYFRKYGAFMAATILVSIMLIIGLIRLLIPAQMTLELLSNFDPAIARFVSGMAGGFGQFLQIFQLIMLVLVLLFGVIRAAPDFQRIERRRIAGISRRLSTPTDYHMEARRAAKAKMWATAVLHWQRAAANEPAQLTYQTHLADAYAQLGFYQRSLDVLQAARQRITHPNTRAKFDKQIQSIQQKQLSKS